MIRLRLMVWLRLGWCWWLNGVFKSIKNIFAKWKAIRYAICHRLYECFVWLLECTLDGVLHLIRWWIKCFRFECVRILSDEITLWTVTGRCWCSVTGTKTRISARWLHTIVLTRWATGFVWRRANNITAIQWNETKIEFQKISEINLDGKVILTQVRSCIPIAYWIFANLGNKRTHSPLNLCRPTPTVIKIDSVSASETDNQKKNIRKGAFFAGAPLTKTWKILNLI